ncbi:DUF6221 family protein [Streptomyces cyaneogriseus]|uniref:DUF6221 family protein n=1 Tax=Streptomyces cyaneogriseus TaxID=68192 RepID=UPI0005C843E7|nr:DUF6221 family protein [Streptomyces cyaneogriseus]
MVEDLAQWLRAQLNEDERIARAAGSGWYGYDPTEQIAFVPPEDTAHIATHSPARVLREIDAKRDLLDAHNGDCSPACRRDHTFSGSCALRWMGPVEEIDGMPWVRNEDGRQVPAPPVTTQWTLRLLALPYADRPGYREEWRP